MKKLVYLVILWIGVLPSMAAHQPGESLSESIIEGQMSSQLNPVQSAVISDDQAFYDSLKPEQEQQVSLSFEKGSDDKESDVLVINGVSQFYQGVIQHSKTKPVIVKICASNSQDSNKIKPIFQDTAKKMKDSVTFVAMDLFDRNEENPENYQIVIKLMLAAGVSRLALPTLLFFRDGRLVKPDPVTQGFLPMDELAKTIEVKLNLK